MGRKLFSLFVAVLLAVACMSVVSAEEFDPRKTGTISVTLTDQYDKEPMVGAELSVYYVAAVHRDMNGKLSYRYTADFEDSGVDLEDPSLATNLDAFIFARELSSVKITTDKNGTATCSALALGLYFIRQTNTVEGFAPCTPFLVTVPIQTTDGFVYDVTASPKTEVAKLTSITIKKVWNTDASTKAADRVTVQLLWNGNVVETATLNEANDWQVTYPDMPQSDAYSIREINIPKGFKATYSKSGYVFTVTNTATLIQTGQLIWPIPLLAFAGVLLIATGIVLLKKKGKTNA